MILTSLTAEDMKLLVADMPPQIRSKLASSDKARKEFAEQLMQIRGMAEEEIKCARAAIEKDKREKLVADITTRHNIYVAEKFEVEIPPAQK